MDAEVAEVMVAAAGAGVVAAVVAAGNGWSCSPVAGGLVVAGGVLPFLSFVVCVAGGGMMLGLQVGLMGALGSLALPFIGACIYPLVDRTRRGALSAGLALLSLGANFGYTHLLFELVGKIG